MIPHSRPWVIERDRHDVDEVLRDECVSQYRWAPKLEHELARRTGAATAYAYGSGTLALCGALRALRLPSGSGAAIPAYICSDVATAVWMAGLVPVRIDCTPSYRFQTSLLDEALRENVVRAIIVAHPFGLVDALEGLNLGSTPVVEDCSHVPRPGFYLEHSLFATGSMEGTKLLGAGEGGYLLARSVAPHFDARGTFQYGRCSDILARLALNQFDRMGENLLRREWIANQYAAIWPPFNGDSLRAAWFRYHVRLRDLVAVEEFIGDAVSAGITIRRPIMPDPSMQPVRTFGSCAVAAELWGTLASVPLYPALPNVSVVHIAEFLRMWREDHQGKIFRP